VWADALNMPTLVGWGANYAGQTNTPAGLANVTQVACGNAHTYALFECPGDLDGSATVDFADISLLLTNFGLAMPGDPADLDASGEIDTADLSLILLSFGDC